jgi:hypothetical protein
MVVCPRALATKQLLAICSKVHKPCILRHTAMSVVEDVQKLIWEVEKTTFVYKKLKEYSDRVLKDKLRYEIYESLVWNWGELRIKQKKCTLTFLFILLGIKLMMLIYLAEAYIL